MAYEALRKLYYGDAQTYQEAYHARWNGELTVHLDFEVSGKQAFFTIPRDVMDLSFAILDLDKQVLRLKMQLPPVAIGQYAKKCLIDEIVLTNKIEGVHSSRKEIGETLAILDRQSAAKGKRHRFVGLVNKYIKLIRKEPVSLDSCEDVRAIYDEIVYDEVVQEKPHNAPDGKIFRKDQTTVRSATDKVIHAGMTPERKIIEAMEKALAFLHDDSVPWLYRSCIFHYMVEYIHPFYDGNGRLGRFIMSYCIAEQLEPLLAYRISETLKEHIREYYDAFEICNDPHNLGDLTPFLILMLRMIRLAAEDLRDGLQRRKIQWDRYEKLVAALPSNGHQKLGTVYSLLIQAALFAENGISTKELTAMCEVSYGTIRKLLNFVQDEGLLISAKEGNEKYYKINLNQLDERLIGV